MGSKVVSVSSTDSNIDKVTVSSSEEYVAIGIMDNDNDYLIATIKRSDWDAIVEGMK
jgi:hypothetical protein